MSLVSPALDISREYLSLDFPNHRPVLFSNGRKLLVQSRQVIVMHGSVLQRKLTFDENIISATFTTFQRSSTDKSKEAIVVCLQNSAHLYFSQGDSHIVSFPFLVKAAFPYDAGILLERDHEDVKGSPPGPFSSYRFFTLVDPIGDLRVVTTSSTSVVTSSETLLYFPAKGINKTHSLCVTLNPRQSSVNVYHVKSSIRHNIIKTNNIQRKKRNQSVTSPNPTKILEEDFHDSILPPYSTNASQSQSLGMDKKRTSTLLSGASSIARMGSEPGFSENKSNPNLNVPDLGSLRKDMIWTKIDTISVKSRKSYLSVCGLVSEDKETIVISNRALKQASIYIYKTSSVGQPVLESSFVMESRHAVALNHPRFDGWLITLKNDSSLQLVNPVLNISAPPIEISGRILSASSIISTVDNLVAVKSVAGDRRIHYINLILEPQNNIVSRCLKCWKYLSGSKISEEVWVLWRSAFMMNEPKDEWDAYVVTLLSLIYPFDGDHDTSFVSNEITALIPQAKLLNKNYNLDYYFYDLIPYIVVSLHLLYEETKLDSLGSKHLNMLGTLLTQLTMWMGWSDQWTTFYMIDHTHIDSAVRILSTSLIYNPPSIFDHLISLFEDRHSNFLRLSQLVEESDFVDQTITPRINAVCRIFEMIASPKAKPSEIVKHIVDLGLDSDYLETFPLGVSIPIKNCLSSCQNYPQFEWSEPILDLVARRDLSMLLSPNIYTSDKGLAQHTSSFPSTDANTIVSTLFSKNENIVAWDGFSEADQLQITKLIFDSDRRFYEITSLLHQTRIQSASLDVDESLSEYETTLMKRELASLVALRTLTIPLGRAALFFAGRTPLLTEKFPIPKFNLNTLITPSMTTIVLSESSLNYQTTEWGQFHNGVSSGLSISPDSTGISGSWVIFNKPSENNAQHAGFLLGLGLNGHLKKLEEWHIYNYLGPKHPLTSVGLLIGMAASLRGTMENKLTKVLSVHAVALLPQGANDLNVPIIVQSAGLIGIGLLYLQTQHRRMSEILLSQFGGTSHHFEHHDEHESYRLAAGIALGFINLGKGDDLRGLNDTHVVDRLLSYATSMRDSHSDFESDKSGSGAILALAFIYMKTRNSIIAQKLQIPHSEQLLDYVRPDLLLLRTLAKNIILWENIMPSKLWIESEIPEFLRKRYNIEKIQILDSDQINLFSVLGGACLSLGIKYASSYNLEARDILLHYMDMTSGICMIETHSYDQSIAFNSACQLQNLLALCASIVMAGTGDIEVFRRLRVLHGRIDKCYGYGNHMASSMALGILFLGGGQYGFGSSDFAIACLIVSLYPVFPKDSIEHEVHLQVLRHFWALSVEQRCLVVRDAIDGSPIKVPVRIGYKDSKTEELNSPVLLANIPNILSVEVSSPSFFNVKIDFSVNSKYLDHFKKFLTIYVLKKRNYESLKSSVAALLQNRSRTFKDTYDGVEASRDISKLLQLRLADNFSAFEKDVYLDQTTAVVEDFDFDRVQSGLSLFNIIDNKLELARKSSHPESIEDILNLKLLFTWADSLLNNQHEYLDPLFVEKLKLNLVGIMANIDNSQ